MYRKVVIATLVVLLGQSVAASVAWTQSVGAADFSSTDAPLVSILADPSAYQDKRIRTVGVLFLAPGESEDSGDILLFLSKEQMEYFIVQSALSLTLSEAHFYGNLGGMHGKYVLVEGRVDALEKEHMGVLAAGLVDVNRIELVGSER